MLAQFDASTALHWLGRQLFNRDDPAAYFDPLLERISPLLAQQSIRAQVIAVLPETHDTATFVLKPAKRWQGFTAGQHIALTVGMNGVNRTRTFSLSSTPQQWQERGTISVTIKRLPGGRVTNWMHDHLRAGATVGLSEAFGEFDLPNAAEPALYIAGGSGITPVLSHLETLANSDYRAPVSLLYYVRTERDIIAADRLRELSDRWPALTVTIFKTEEGSKDQYFGDHHLEQVPGVNARQCYLCGPKGLMDAANDLLHSRNIPSDRIQCTFFSAPSADLGSDALGGAVHFENSALKTESTGDASLLDIAEASGLSPKHGCRMGICHQCSCRKTSGTVINRVTGETSSPGDETIQLCVSVPKGAVTLDL